MTYNKLHKKDSEILEENPLDWPAEKFEELLFDHLSKFETKFWEWHQSDFYTKEHDSKVLENKQIFDMFDFSRDDYEFNNAKKEYEKEKKYFEDNH